jgi:hypothetical protein
MRINLTSTRPLVLTFFDVIRAGLLLAIKLEMFLHNPDRPRVLECPVLFKIGDEVKWAWTALDKTKQNATGVVTFVIPSDTNVEEFAIYDVKFDFGSLTLHGTQLERTEPIRRGKP